MQRDSSGRRMQVNERETPPEAPGLQNRNVRQQAQNAPRPIYLSREGSTPGICRMHQPPSSRKSRQNSREAPRFQQAVYLQAENAVERQTQAQALQREPRCRAQPRHEWQAVYPSENRDLPPCSERMTRCRGKGAEGPEWILPAENARSSISNRTAEPRYRYSRTNAQVSRNRLPKCTAQAGNLQQAPPVAGTAGADAEQRNVNVPAEASKCSRGASVSPERVGENSCTSRRQQE
jgi:hypothetical protein